MTSDVDLFVLYNLVVGALAAVGIVYLFYVQRYVVEFHSFLYYLLAGFLVFSIGGPLADLYVPNWSHAVHGIAALFVVLALYNPVHNDLRKDEWAKLVLADPEWIRHPGDWMTPMDDRIIELFHSSDLVLTPGIIAYNIDYSRGEVNRRLSELEDHGFVEKLERGKYRLTDRGERYLSGN
jgi:DNA-binding transcriptional ArsR family regulator